MKKDLEELIEEIKTLLLDDATAEILRQRNPELYAFLMNTTGQKYESICTLTHEHEKDEEKK